MLYSKGFPIKSRIKERVRDHIPNHLGRKNFEIDGAFIPKFFTCCSFLRNTHLKITTRENRKGRDGAYVHRTQYTRGHKNLPTHSPKKARKIKVPQQYWFRAYYHCLLAPGVHNKDAFFHRKIFL